MSKACDICGSSILEADAVVEFVEHRPVMINGQAVKGRKWQTGGSSCWGCWVRFRGWGE